MMYCLAKSQQQLMPLFEGKFIENKPIPFPENFKSQGYSNLFYWAHLEAKETGEFPLHPHKGFEIMTFVFDGALEHYDTATQVWTPLQSGGVQVIQAGSGIHHAEKIVQGSRLFQIWFDPGFSTAIREIPSYKDYSAEVFSVVEENGIQTLHYIGNKGPIKSRTPNLHVRKLSLKIATYNMSVEYGYTYSFYLLDGTLKLNQILMQKDSFLMINQSEDIELEVLDESELFMVVSPSTIAYKRYIDGF